jgi:hypothetical protein
LRRFRIRWPFTSRDASNPSKKVSGLPAD